MKLSNDREVIARRYQEQDTEAIVNLIRRNFLEVNVKDYGEKAMKALAEHHDDNWFKGVAAYANVYVFCVEDEIIGVGSISSFWGKFDREHSPYYFCIAGIAWQWNWAIYYTDIRTG